MTITKEENQTQASLVGRFFITASQDGELHNQGRINELLPNDRYIVSLFSWLTGGETAQLVVSGGDICKYFTLSGKCEKDHGDFCDYYSRGKNRKLPTPPYDVGKGAQSGVFEIDTEALKSNDEKNRTDAAGVAFGRMAQNILSAMPDDDDDVHPKCDVAYAAFSALINLEAGKSSESWQKFLREALLESINEYNATKD